jgi:glycosidase
MKKILMPFLCIAGLAAGLAISACAKNGALAVSEPALLPTSDKYGTFYQIFPYSFADSNGDGIGDLKGIIDKLDYIDSLHYDGLWLTPVQSSGSYHKYDIDNYESIDSAFGTLGDYDDLVTAVHGKGMKILLDLVFNHTSVSSPWFSKCLQAHYNKQTASRYYNYYNVEDYTGTIPTGYAQASDYPSLVYECRFWSGMPDLDLDEVLANPDGYLATDLKDVIHFWLVNHKVDGFRLDAVTSYFTDDTVKNGEFLKWLHDYSVSLKSDAYIVGEGSWTSPTENLGYQTASGVDSFFNFEDAKASGYVAQTIIHSDPYYFYQGLLKNLSSVTSTGIPAPFIANHDTGRLYSAAYGALRTSNLKFAHALLQLMNGCTFLYYGDEAGMKVNGTKDEDIRQPMPWGDTYTCKSVYGSTVASDADKYPLGTVAAQLADASSLPNFVKKANQLRRAFPSIPRGAVAQVYESDDGAVGVIRKTYGSEVTYLAINASASDSLSWDFGSVDAKLAVKAALAPSGDFALEGTKLTLPSQSVAVLEENS